MVDFHPERYLHKYQLEILEEAFTRFYGDDREMINLNGCGYNIPTGGGKTILTLATGMILNQREREKRQRKIKKELKKPEEERKTIKKIRGTLIVLEKSLLYNWKNEIEKLNSMIRKKNKEFRDEPDREITFYLAHSECENESGSRFDASQTSFDDDYDFVITNINVCMKGYKDGGLEEYLISKVEESNGNFKKNVDYYDKHPKPRKNTSCIYNRMWSLVVVDEIHNYLNITTIGTRSICSIPGLNKLGLSGTMFDNPDPKKLLSFMTFIGNDNWGSTVSTSKSSMSESAGFDGLRHFAVTRTKEQLGIKVEFKNHYITVPMTPREKKVFEIFSDILLVIFERKRIAEQNKKRDVEGESIVLLSRHILVLLVYIRECLITPIIPITALYLKSLSYRPSVNKDDELNLQEIINVQFRQNEIYEHFNSSSSILSSRIREVMKIANLPKNKKVLIFTGYRKPIDLILEGYSNCAKPVKTFTSKMKASERGLLIDELSQEESFIFLLTYEIGSVGLNLQFADTVICMDYDFSSVSVPQAVARVVRQGQKQKVNVYYICSDTYLERQIAKKQLAKFTRGQEILTGELKTGIEKIDSEDLCKFLVQGETLNAVQEANSREEFEHKDQNEEAEEDLSNIPYVEESFRSYNSIMDRTGDLSSDSDSD